jgi:alpha-L-fucosidase
MKLGLPLVTLVALAACRSSAPVPPPAAPAVVQEGGVVGGVVPKDGPYQDRPEFAWWRQSMETRDQRLGWWREARFGMFMHWGVYSHLGGVWEGTPVSGYAEHIMRRRKIPIAVYREKVAGQFNPVKFDAEQWVRTLKNAGMGYLIITSKHHDGFAMFDSDVTDYDVVDSTAWKHDPMKDLKEACKRQGVRFGFYYSQAWDWGDPNGTGNDWDYQNPAGDKNLGGPNWADNPEARAKLRKYVDGKAIPQVRELIKKYDPDIMWFDTPAKMPAEENLRVLEAARAAKPTLVVNSRIVQGTPRGPRAHFGDYQSTTDKPDEFPPNDFDWEAIPTTNESYGWHKMDHSHKPPVHFIRLLAKAAARGGNVLLNIGPMGDGQFDPADVQILTAIGSWMKVNGESIHGTARTPLPVQAWGESTRKGSTLYLHVFTWPKAKPGKLVVGGLTARVKRAYLLADQRRTPLEVQRSGDKDVLIDVPDAAPDANDSVVAVEVEGDPTADPARVLGTEAPDTLRAFDAQLRGGLGFGSGKLRDAYVQRWNKLEGSVRWPVRLREPATYEVAISYDADRRSAGGSYVVKLGDRSLPGTVGETTSRSPQPLGKVTLPAGAFEISVEPIQISGGELLRLRSLTLTPAKN